MRRLLIAALAAASLPAAAQTPTQALAARWNTICATAGISGGQLLVRCTETAASSSPNADLIAAEGQNLEEIPGHARVATRDGAAPTAGFQVQAGPASLATRLADPTATSIALRFAAADEGDEGGGDLAADWALFASLEGGWLDRDDGPNEAAFDGQTVHATFGVDRRVGGRGQLGAAINIDREQLDYTGTDGGAEAAYVGLIAFTSVQLADAWVIDAYAGHSRGGYDLTRRVFYTLPMVGGGSVVVDAIALAEPDSWRRALGAGVGWSWSRGAWHGDIGAGFDVARTHIDAYAETGGGGLALEVPERNVDTRRGRVDARVGRTVSTNWGVWQPSLRLGWRQEFGNERRRVTVQLADDALDNLITFDTEDPDRGWGELALSSVFTFTRGHSGFVEYRQRLAHEFLQERIVAVGWRMELP